MSTNLCERFLDFVLMTWTVYGYDHIQSVSVIFKLPSMSKNSTAISVNWIISSFPALKYKIHNKKSPRYNQNEVQVPAKTHLLYDSLEIGTNNLGEAISGNFPFFNNQLQTTYGLPAKWGYNPCQHAELKGKDFRGIEPLVWYIDQTGLTILYTKIHLALGFPPWASRELERVVPGSTEAAGCLWWHLWDLMKPDMFAVGTLYLRRGDYSSCLLAIGDVMILPRVLVSCVSVL